MKRIKFFSIITICKNNLEGLTQTVESVKNQSFKDFEFIIIDGNSSDGTIEYVRSQDIIDVFVSEDDSGVYDAMNKGISLSNSEYLIFLNSGDSFYDGNVLKDVSPKLRKDKKIFFGNCIFQIDKSNRKVIVPNQKKLSFDFGLPFNHQSCFTPSKLFENRKFQTHLKILGDLEFYRTIYKEAPSKFEYIPRSISVFDDGGISSIYSMKYLREVKEVGKFKFYNFKFIKFYLKYIIKWMVNW